MYDLFKRVFLHIHGMWRYRWAALLAAWIVSASLWLFVYMLPDVYEASTRVYIDTQTVLKPLLEGLAVDSDLMTEVNLMTQALMSRPNLEKVARETDLDHRARTPLEMEDLLDGLARKIRISEGLGNLFTIRYRDIDRATARNVVQTLLDSLVEGTLGANRSDSVAAQDFLENQLKEYEVRLAEAEQRLAEFKQGHVGMMPSEGRDYYARMQLALEELEKTNSELKIARNRSREIRRQLEGDMPVYFGLSGPAANSPVSKYDKRIEGYQQDLDQLLLKYTDDHPDVIAMRDLIEQFKSRRQEALGAAEDVATLDKNPIHQRMTAALNEAEVDLAILTGKSNEQQRKLNKLRKLVDTIPDVEAELTRLNRDYDVTKGQYETLLQRLESARLSEEADLSTDDVEFRIIDPPVVPLEPSGPPRTLYLAMALVAGIAAALGLAFILDQIRPAFQSREKLKEILQLPVLGAVRVIYTASQQSRQQIEHISFYAGAAMLMVAFVGAVYYQGAATNLARSLMRTL